MGTVVVQGKKTLPMAAADVTTETTSAPATAPGADLAIISGEAHLKSLQKSAKATYGDGRGVCVVITPGESDEDPTPFCTSASRAVRKALPHSFIAVKHPRAADRPLFRQSCFGNGVDACNMVTACDASLEEARRLVRVTNAGGGHLTCPYSGCGGFTEDQLWLRTPLYHVNAPNPKNTVCPLCGEGCSARRSPWAVHLRNEHGPCARGEVEKEKQTGIFAIVVCRRSDGRFLMVQEFAQTGFWCPGGQVDPQESLCAAVERETLEEAGVAINLTGVLDVIVDKDRDWRRVTFVAEPADESELPKSLPDYESTGACWATVEEVVSGDLKLRGREPFTLFQYVAQGGEVLPLEIPSEYKAGMSDVPF